MPGVLFREWGAWEVSSATFPELNWKPFFWCTLKCILMYHHPGAGALLLLMFSLVWSGFFSGAGGGYNKHLRDMHWPGKCCLLKSVQVGQREWHWLHVWSEEVILSIFLSQLFKLVSEDTGLFDCFVLQQGLNYLFAFWDLGINKSPDIGHCWLSGGKGDRMFEVSSRCPCVFMTWCLCRVPTSVPPSVSLWQESLARQRFFFSPSAFPTLISIFHFFILKYLCSFSFSLLLEEIRIVLFHSLKV